ncbi:MAG: hypothetical protein NTY64_16790, partial [Deltaproteobacteria bacterium]|nr:hypothetical protein [Deltaproteobacteria bacterium]
REKAKKEETQAAPFYENALQGIEKTADPKEKAYLLGALAADWAGVDEKKALAVAEKLSAKFPEPYSYALLKVGAQLGKWNRQEAEVVFQKTLAATDALQDSSLKGRRLWQLAGEWRRVNQEKGREVLGKALGEAGKNTRDPILPEMLLTWVAWEPENALIIGRSAEGPMVKTQILAEGARVLGKKFLEENKKPLEKALQFAQGTKRSTLMSEIGQAWYTFERDKGLELIRQVETKKIRVKALFEMAQKRRPVNKEESKYLLDLATEEALKMEILPEQVQWLRKIARDWGELDREKAKKTYLRAYQVAERTYHSSPKFDELVKSR